MKVVEGLLIARISDDPDKIERQTLLWDDLLTTIQYIMNNPKYREIDPTFGRIAFSIHSEEGGATSELQSQQT